MTPAVKGDRIMRIRAFTRHWHAALSMMFVLAGCGDQVTTDPVPALDQSLQASRSVATITDEALRIFQAPDAQAFAQFGISVAGVGENVLVGASLHTVDGLTNAGRAYLFDRNGAPLQTLQAPDAQAFAQFGRSVAGVGENVLVGAAAHDFEGLGNAGQAYLFDQNGTLLRTFRAPDAQASADFGISVAAVGEKVLVGAAGHDVNGLGNAGQVYLFDQDGALLRTFQAPDAQAGGVFGVSVAGVGENVLVGATGHDVEGLSNAGQAYVFDQNGTHLHTLQALDAQALAQFGRSVAGVAETFLVSALGHNANGLTFAGQAYLFDENGAHFQTFQAPDAQARAVFGISVAGVGENVLVGASRHDIDGLTFAGQAYLFDRNGTHLQTFQAPDVQVDARFGQSVAGVGGDVLVAAFLHDVDGLTNAGRAYLFGTETDPVAIIEQLLDDISALEAVGRLNRGQSNALRATLNSTLTSIEKNSLEAACGQLGAFIKQVAAGIRSGRLTDEEGEPLITSAEAAMDALCE